MTERDLTALATLAAGVLDAISARTAVLDADGEVLAFNRAWIEFETARRGRLRLRLGDNYFEAVSSAAAPAWWGGSRAATGILSVLTGRRARFAMDYDVMTDDGAKWFELVVESLPQLSGGVLLSHNDITDRKSAEESLLVRALHDDLTGLPNRALLLDRINQALSKSMRSSHNLVVMFIDIDRFKVINDSLGHAAGDCLLIEVAARLRRSIRLGDTVGRLGGDEFLVLCEPIGGEHEAVTIAERILSQIEEPVRIGGETVYPSASIGIALDLLDDITVDELVANADAAMYLAKADSKRRYAVYDDSLAARTADRMQEEHDLRDAIGGNQLRVMCQPQYDLRSGRLVGMEAMVRWDHPTRGVIGPAEFLTFAEDTGLIVPLGRWVLAHICGLLADWGGAGPLGDDGRLWMNLSAPELAVPNLVDHIIDTLQRTGARASQLGLELTEAALMHYPEAATEVLTRLREIGVAVALDDFGSGHASLSYLSGFPVAVIKLDRGFVSDLGTPVAGAIAASIVALAAGLRIDVIAEGIETAGQLRILRELGVKLGQGYLFAPPLPPHELTTRVPAPLTS